jgi:hypothetical protein
VPGSQYHIELVAYNYKYGFFSPVNYQESVPATLDPPTVPSVPIGLDATNIIPGTGGPGTVDVQLSWTAPADPVIIGYNIYRSDLPGAPIGTVLAPTTTFTDLSVNEGSYYTYTVSAYNATGDGPAASLSVNAQP